MYKLICREKLIDNVLSWAWLSISFLANEVPAFEDIKIIQITPFR